MRMRLPTADDRESGGVGQSLHALGAGPAQHRGKQSVDQEERATIPISPGVAAAGSNCQPTISLAGYAPSAPASIYRATLKL